MPATIEDPITRVLDRLPGHKKSGNGWEAPCPAHEDKRASLSISEGDDGRVLLTCHAGCTFKEIVSAMSMKPNEMFRKGRGKFRTAATTKHTKKPRKTHKTIEEAAHGFLMWKKATFAGQWNYKNADDTLCMTVARGNLADGGKELFPLHQADGGWQIGLPPKELYPQGFPLYRVYELPHEGPVYVVEGEKCADAMWQLGLPAVTSQGGAKASGKSDWSSLSGRDVVLLPDRDKAGEQYIKAVANSLLSIGAARIKVCYLEAPAPGETDSGYDVADFVEALDSKDDEAIKKALQDQLDTATDWIPPTDDSGCPDDAGNIDDNGEVHPDELATELRNAEEVRKCHGSTIRYNANRGEFLVYRERSWEYDERGLVDWLVKQEARKTWTRLNKADSKIRARHSVRMESAAGVAGVKKLLSSELGIPVVANDLDADDFLFNCRNGTIDLRTGDIRPHNPADLITKLVHVDYDPHAQCPRWLQFLNEIMAGNARLIGYLQRLAGLCLTGSANVQELFVLYGQGANGKSVFIDTLLGILGPYGGIAPESLVISRHNQEHPTEIADLCGKRAVVASETEAGAQLRLQFIKRLTGDKTLKGRYMRQDFFEFRRTHKLLLVTNGLPRITESSEAVWRRLRIIPFGVVIPAERRDPLLLDKLIAEWTGILSWAVRGCLDWQQNGMQPPQEVLLATDEFRNDADTLAQFFESKTVQFNGARVSRTDLHAAYVAWASKAGEKSLLDNATLYARVRQLEGIEDSVWKIDGVAVRGFVGIGLCGGMP